MNRTLKETSVAATVQDQALDLRVSSKPRDLKVSSTQEVKSESRQTESGSRLDQLLQQSLQKSAQYYQDQYYRSNLLQIDKLDAGKGSNFSNR